MTDRIGSLRSPSRSSHPFVTPLSPDESCAKYWGIVYLNAAKMYRSADDVTNAVMSCLEGLRYTTGISRPLAVRDELADLLDLLDPTGAIRKIHRGRLYLERLVSVHQLLEYPSEYTLFNFAYESAKEALRSSQFVQELYVVQYRTRSDKLQFTFVDGGSLSAAGPYHLSDICAVVRR